MPLDRKEMERLRDRWHGIVSESLADSKGTTITSYVGDLTKFYNAIGQPAPDDFMSAVQNGDFEKEKRPELWSRVLDGFTRSAHNRAMRAMRIIRLHHVERGGDDKEPNEVDIKAIIKHFRDTINRGKRRLQEADLEVRELRAEVKRLKAGDTPLKSAKASRVWNAVTAGAKPQSDLVAGQPRALEDGLVVLCSAAAKDALSSAEEPEKEAETLARCGVEQEATVPAEETERDILQGSGNTEGCYVQGEEETEGDSLQPSEETEEMGEAEGGVKIPAEEPEIAEEAQVEEPEQEATVPAEEMEKDDARMAELTVARSSALANSNESLRERVREDMDTIRKLTKETADLEERATAADIRAHIAETELTNAKMKLKSARDECNTARKGIKRLQGRLKAAENECNTTKEELKKMQGKLQAAEDECNTTKEEMRKLQGRAAASEGAYAMKIKECEEALGANAKLRKALEDKDAEGKALERKLVRARKKSSSLRPSPPDDLTELSAQGSDDESEDLESQPDGGGDPDPSDEVESLEDSGCGQPRKQPSPRGKGAAPLGGTPSKDKSASSPPGLNERHPDDSPPLEYCFDKRTMEMLDRASADEAHEDDYWGEEEPNESTSGRVHTGVNRGLAPGTNFDYQTATARSHPPVRGSAGYERQATFGRGSRHQIASPEPYDDETRYASRSFRGDRRNTNRSGFPPRTSPSTQGMSHGSIIASPSPGQQQDRRHSNYRDDWEDCGDASYRGDARYDCRGNPGSPYFSGSRPIQSQFGGSVGANVVATSHPDEGGSNYHHQGHSSYRGRHSAVGLQKGAEAARASHHATLGATSPPAVGPGNHGGSNSLPYGDRYHTARLPSVPSPGRSSYRASSAATFPSVRAPRNGPAYGDRPAREENRTGGLPSAPLPSSTAGVPAQTVPSSPIMGRENVSVHHRNPTGASDTSGVPQGLPPSMPRNVIEPEGPRQASEPVSTTNVSSTTTMQPIGDAPKGFGRIDTIYFSGYGSWEVQGGPVREQVATNMHGFCFWDSIAKSFDPDSEATAQGVFAIHFQGVYRKGEYAAFADVPDFVRKRFRVGPPPPPTKKNRKTVNQTRRLPEDYWGTTDDLAVMAVELGYDIYAYNATAGQASWVRVDKTDASELYAASTKDAAVVVPGQSIAIHYTLEGGGHWTALRAIDAEARPTFDNGKCTGALEMLKAARKVWREQSKQG